MAIYDAELFMPDEIMELVNVGLCVIDGGAVRVAEGLERGQIVKLFEIIKLNPAAKDNGLITMVKEHKKAIAIGLATATVVGVTAYCIHKSHGKKEQKTIQGSIVEETGRAERRNSEL